jgi:hypothetical protein
MEVSEVTQPTALQKHHEPRHTQQASEPVVQLAHLELVLEGARSVPCTTAA